MPSGKRSSWRWLASTATDVEVGATVSWMALRVNVFIPVTLLSMSLGFV